ncbi:MAG: glycosyltransferase family 4 protein [Candidatus Latescibacterota bacterium]
MQRVLYLDHHTQVIGGGQVSLLGLMSGLEHFAPVCACGPGGELEAGVRRAGIPCLPLEQPPFAARHMLAVTRAVGRLWEAVRRQRPALLHANSSRSMAYAGLVGRWARLPVVWHVRIVASDGWWDRVLARRATRLVVVSEAVRARFPWPDARARVCVVPNAVDVDAMARGDGEAARRRLGCGAGPLVGMVAQLVPNKRPEDFLRAAALVAERFPDCRFLLVGREPEGGGYGAYLRELASRLGLGERVVFAGFQDDVPGVMAALDVVVLTSAQEAFGRVLVEAMAAGRPVVATRSGGVAEVVADQETGILVPVGDVPGIAAAVAAFLAAPERARAMGLAGQARARQEFGLEAHVGRMEAAYRAVLGGS